ncbi:MAG: hypothetical protein AAFQ51_01495 [Pseudomonadota bacterium]
MLTLLVSSLAGVCVAASSLHEGSARAFARGWFVFYTLAMDLNVFVPLMVLGPVMAATLLFLPYVLWPLTLLILWPVSVEFRDKVRGIAERSPF